MAVVVDPELVIRNLVRVSRALDERPNSEELIEVRADLESLLGGSASRTLAARLLGVSRTALDKRIQRGDVPMVITRDGRREVPVAAVVDLLGALDRADTPAGAKSALGAVLDERRRDAEQLDPEQVLPRRYRNRDRLRERPGELRALAYHRVVADRLDETAVARARERLRRWERAGKLNPAYAREWERLLARPMPVIQNVIARDSERARDLRQNSPFAGELTEPLRRRVLDVVAGAG